MSLFEPHKMSLNESKNWASKSRRLKDSCLANTLFLLRLSYAVDNNN